jgi:hypothetical protein
VLYFPIFRVPEYSELLIRTDRKPMESREWNLLNSEYSW